jgi:hypothetical protein
MGSPRKRVHIEERRALKTDFCSIPRLNSWKDEEESAKETR